MSRSGYKWRKLAFRMLFSAIGLILFTAQVSYKFYRSASMPVFRPSGERHAICGAVSGTDADEMLSLDKRFDLKPSFAILTPVFRFLLFANVASILSSFAAPRPVGPKPLFTPLRGPPHLT